MNLYFLVEGRSTEKKVYPKIISHFIGSITPVKEFDQVSKNNYFLLSGNGYPRILSNVLKNSILDINATDKYDYLIICIDSDNNTFEERKDELDNYLRKFKDEEGIELSESCRIILIVQNRCIETWFLGNEKIFRSNPQSESLRRYQQFFNVKHLDPENSPIHDDFDTHASFHLAYLKEALLERNIRYTKNNPREVAEPYYLRELHKRSTSKNHLKSFQDLVEFCAMIKTQIASQKSN